MALFNVPTRANRSLDSSIAKKSNTQIKVTATVKGGNDLMGRINSIKAMTESALGQFKDETLIIRDYTELEEYINKAIVNDVIAIDTETTGLDPMLDKIVGLCIYTPNMKTAYVPINHISYITQLPIDNQLSEKDIAKQLERLNEHNTKIIMFNANFDIRVIRNQVGVYLTCYWDCYIAERLMNENEPKKGLKPVHQKYVLKGVGDAFKFDDLFSGIPFNLIPINVGSLYAAHDAIITYELYKFQEPYLTVGTDECTRCSLEDVAWVFRNVEMPCIDVCANMEDNGIEFDNTYCAELSEKYNQLLEDKKQEFYDACEDYILQINSFRDSGYKLDNPINIGSSQQIATLIYDIIGVEPPDARNPRGTGVEILSAIDHPICKAILGYREVQKLLSTYIDKLPTCVNPNDGRIHCKFNQYGADTGRFSSSDPKQYWAVV